MENWVKFYLDVASNMIVFLADILVRMDVSFLFCETFFRPRSNLGLAIVTHCSFAKPNQA